MFHGLCTHLLQAEFYLRRMGWDPSPRYGLNTVAMLPFQKLREHFPLTVCICYLLRILIASLSCVSVGSIHDTARNVFPAFARAGTQSGPQLAFRYQITVRI